MQLTSFCMCRHCAVRMSEMSSVLTPANSLATCRNTGNAIISDGQGTAIALHGSRQPRLTSVVMYSFRTTMRSLGWQVKGLGSTSTKRATSGKRRER